MDCRKAIYRDGRWRGRGRHRCDLRNPYGYHVGLADVVHIDGLYHKQGISEKMTEARYARAIAEWLKPWTRIYPQIANVYVDSAAKLFRAALREELSKQGMGRIAVIGTDKSDGIRPRIELVCMLLMQGRYHVAEASCAVARGVADGNMG